MGFGGAAGRLIEFGQRQRRAQFEAARALLLRDGDGGLEGFFRGRGVGGVALEQHFAARPMQFCFERAIAQAIARRQRFVEDRNRARSDRLPGLRPRPARSSKARRTADVLFAQQIDAAAHVPEPVGGRAAVRSRPTLEKHAERAKHGQVMLARETGEFEDVRRGARVVATHQFEESRVQSCKRERADMGEVRDPRLHAVDERNRAIDLAERPRRDRQIDHRGDAGVQPEAKGQIVVAAGLEQGERTFQVIPRLAILAGEPASDPGGAMGDAASGESGLASTSLRKAAACARIDGNSPRR